MGKRSRWPDRPRSARGGWQEPQTGKIPSRTVFFSVTPRERPCYYFDAKSQPIPDPVRFTRDNVTLTVTAIGRVLLIFDTLTDHDRPHRNSNYASLLSARPNAYTAHTYMCSPALSLALSSLLLYHRHGRSYPERNRHRVVQDG